jgi:hypothetical protein
MTKETLKAAVVADVRTHRQIAKAMGYEKPCFLRHMIYGIIPITKESEEKIKAVIGIVDIVE